MRIDTSSPLPPILSLFSSQGTSRAKVEQNTAGKVSGVQPQNKQSDIFHRPVSAEAPEFVVPEENQKSVNNSNEESNRPINTQERYTNLMLDAMKSGKSMVEALVETKAELFKELFAKELEANNGDVKDAIHDAKANLKMDLSDQELLGIVQELASDYQANGDIAEQLSEIADDLYRKIEQDRELEKDKPKSTEGTQNKENLSGSLGNSQNLLNLKSAQDFSNLFNNKRLNPEEFTQENRRKQKEDYSPLSLTV